MDDFLKRAIESEEMNVVYSLRKTENVGKSKKQSQALAYDFFPSSIEVIRDIINNKKEVDERNTFREFAEELGNKFDDTEEQLIIYFNEPAKIAYFFENNKVKKILATMEDGNSYGFERSALEPKKEIQREENNTVSTNEIIDNKFKVFSQEIEGHPTFRFYFPKDLGEYVKTNSTVFEIKEGNVQKVRVMISKCALAENLEADARKWVEKNKSDAKMDEVTYRKENINGIPIEVYELKYAEHEEWPHKIYKIGFFEGYRITISGWLVKGREEIINQAFEKLETDGRVGKDGKNIDEKKASQIIIDYRYNNHDLLVEIHIDENKVDYYNGPNHFSNITEYENKTKKITDKSFIEKMLICNVYLPHKEKLMAMFNEVKKYSKDEFNKHYNTVENSNTNQGNPGILKIKEDQNELIADIRNDLYDSQIVYSFTMDLKKTIEWYLNKNN